MLGPCRVPSRTLDGIPYPLSASEEQSVVRILIAEDEARIARFVEKA